MHWRSERRLGLLVRLCTLLAFVAPFQFLSCGIYTFSGSTLPAHLKTVDIPLFSNQSLQPGIAEYLTQQLSRSVLQNNLLKIVPGNGDATIEGTVLGYNNQPYTYNNQSALDVDVTSYAVTITVAVKFIDNKKGKNLYEGTITQDGIYSFTTETEDKGREKAVGKIITQIMQNSVQQW